MKFLAITSALGLIATLAACSRVEKPSPSKLDESITKNAVKQKSSTPGSAPTVFMSPEEFPYLDRKISEDSPTRGEFILANETQSYSNATFLTRHVCIVYREGIRTYFVASEKNPDLENPQSRDKVKFTIQADHFWASRIPSDSIYWKSQELLKSGEISEKVVYIPKQSQVIYQHVVTQSRDQEKQAKKTNVFFQSNKVIEEDGELKMLLTRIHDPLSIEIAQQLRVDCEIAARAAP